MAGGGLRSLHIQVRIIVVVTVVAVLAFSQWVDERLSDLALERDLEQRSVLAAHVVDSLWDAGDWQRIQVILASLVGNHREIIGVDVYGFEEGKPPTLLASTGRQNEPSASQAAPPRFDGTIGFTGFVSAPQGAGLRDRSLLDVPVRRKGRTVGAVRTEVSRLAVSELRRRLQETDIVMLLFSATALSLALGLVFRRRVDKPVSALVTAMRRAAAGDLDTRVQPQQSEEFDYLAGSFNRMTEQIQELTTDLESRVQQATLELSERNRELHEANTRLRHAQLEAVRRERFAALGQMAATLAHELGTPLNSVLGYTQLLRRQPMSAENDAKLQILESQVRRMVEIIRSLLDRTRERPPPRLPVEVEPLVAEAIETVEGRLMEKHVVVKPEIPPGMPALSGDPVALRQMLVNLLANAVDASAEAGEILVRASTLGPRADDGRILELVVRDHGVGISADRLSHIFEPFYTTKCTGSGSGLGLSIVDQIVHAHGGRIEVESEPGRGTTFRVRLPMEAW